jgi:xylulokinase
LSFEPPFLLGVDAGTSRVRAVLFDRCGREVSAAAVPTPVATPAPGQADYDPEVLWQAAARVIGEAACGLPAGAPLAGLAVASVGESAVPVDPAGRPLAPAMAWFDDRTKPQLIEVERTLGRDRLFALTGLAPDHTFGAYKLLWLRQHWPDAFAAMRRWLNVSDWIAFRLTGVQATDYSLASRTHLLDLSARAWADELFDSLRLDATVMAPLRPCGARLGEVLPEIAAELGLPGGVAVGVGGHDHILGALAAGAIRQSVMLDSLGTAEALLLATEAAVRDQRAVDRGYAQEIATVGDLQLSCIFGGLVSCGGAIAWFREKVAGGATFDALAAEAGTVLPGAGGTLFVPHLRYSAMPHPDTCARGAFVGLSAEAGRAELFRAVLEGVALEGRAIVEGALDLPGVQPPERIRVIGGGTRNELFLRIKASVLGRALEVSPAPETTALGAALMGGLAAAVWPDLDTALADLAGEWRMVEPYRTWQADYDALFEQAYAGAYDALRPLNHALAAWQGG